MKTEKNTKTTKQPAKKQVASKTVAKAEVKKAPVKKAPAKKEAPKKVEPVKEQAVVEKVAVEEVKPAVTTPKAEAVAKKPLTLNQDLNLVIALFSILTVLALCFKFVEGDSDLIGWELILNSNMYSGVFKGLMIAFVVTIFIDCILSIPVDSENEIFNTIEKVLYMITAVMNVIVVAVLLVLIKNIGLGLIMFLILSIVSVLIKLTRVYSKCK